MNILISINDNFVHCTIDMIKSIMLNDNGKINVYLIYENLSDDSIKVLTSVLEENDDCKLFLFKHDFDKSNFVINLKHVCQETYFRLYAPFILPDNLDRILYLDGDIICNGPLQDLYEMPFDGNILAACENIDPNKDLVKNINKRLGRPIDSLYFNAGVLLINLDEYRKYITEEEMNSFIDSNREILHYQDQDVINILFDGKIKKIDFTYNYQINHVELQNLEYNKRIVHYVSPSKPWHDSYYLPFHGIDYYKYLIKQKKYSEFSNLIAAHLKNTNLDVFSMKKLLKLIFKD